MIPMRSPKGTCPVQAKTGAILPGPLVVGVQTGALGALFTC